MYMKKFCSPYIPHSHPRDTFQKGFSMLESVLGIGLFVMITFSLYTTWTRMFDPLTISADAPFTQARLYGEWQENLGRTTFRFVGEKNGKAVAYIQLTEYPLIKDRKYLYAPYGPVVSEFSNEILEAVKEKMMAVARERNAVFIRLDFTPAARDQNKIAQLDKHFKRAPSYTYHSAS
jgi:hypothetical protein